MSRKNRKPSPELKRGCAECGHLACQCAHAPETPARVERMSETADPILTHVVIGIDLGAEPNTTVFREVDDDGRVVELVMRKGRVVSRRYV